MQKPDWKVAVIGGSIAALGLGGFAAAQTGTGDNDDTVPESIRLQREASMSVQSLSSLVTVAPSTTTSQVDNNDASVGGTASLASLDNDTQTNSVASVPEVAPEPQPAPTPAPAPAPPGDDSVDSEASIASVDSEDSVDSVDSEDSVDSSD